MTFTPPKPPPKPTESERLKESIADVTRNIDALTRQIEGFEMSRDLYRALRLKLQGELEELERKNHQQ